MLKRSNLKDNAIAVLSAVPLSLAIEMVDTPIKWLMFFLSFYCGIEANLKQGIKRGLIVGFATAIINFIWIVKGTISFTGSGLLLGFLIMLSFCVVFSLYTMFVGAAYVILRGSLSQKFSWIFISVGGGCLFVLIDACMLVLGKGFSTCMHVNYIPFATNLYAIQPSSYFGPLIITFVVVMVNYQMAYFVYFKKWKMLFIPIVLLLLYLGWGRLIYEDYNKRQNNEFNSFNVAILQQNIPPNIIWNDSSGGLVSTRFFRLNEAALETKAPVFIWSETAVPWNYTKEDDFLQQIDRITSPHGVIHLLGMNTDYKGRTFFNSVYGIGPHMKIYGRYDKRSALSLVEKPFLDYFLPFFSPNSFRVKEGVDDSPIVTPYGKAGVLLCNESATPNLAKRSVDAGATFLVNPGNDGWFSSTYIPKQHFFHARLRAVENRKDIVINNNNGFSGVVKSNGDITLMERGESSKIGVAEITPNSIKTMSYFGQSGFVCFCFFLLMVCIYFNNKEVVLKFLLSRFDHNGKS